MLKTSLGSGDGTRCRLARADGVALVAAPGLAAPALYLPRDIVMVLSSWALKAGCAGCRARSRRSGVVPARSSHARVAAGRGLQAGAFLGGAT